MSSPTRHSLFKEALHCLLPSHKHNSTTNGSSCQPITAKIDVVATNDDEDNNSDSDSSDSDTTDDNQDFHQGEV